MSELILTGGEPFLLPDIDEPVAACTTVLPTTLLTNANALPRPSTAAAAADEPEPPGAASQPRLRDTAQTRPTSRDRIVAAGGAVASVGSTGDSYDNALTEAFNSLFKADLVR